MQSKALGGLRVVDLSRVLAGPYCSMMLGDLGAEVIKIEAPQRGDDTRHWGPPWQGPQSAYFLSANRNKRSLTLDLKTPQGLEILHRLLELSDVLLENFKVGTAARMGIDFPSLEPRYPGLIYCSISGYGQTGPLASRPGYDFAIQAEGGIMSITGPVDGEPSKVGVAIADITAGLFAHSAILAALLHRERTGRGQYIDVALFDAQLAWLANVAQNYLVSGENPARYGNAHPNIVPYQSFATQDGQIALAIGNDAQFQRFCQRAGRPELSADVRFQTNAQRVEHRELLIALLEPLLKAHTTAEWLCMLEAATIPCAPIQTVSQALEHPQAKARDMVQQVEHPDYGKASLLGPVAKMSATPATVKQAPPTLGQHNREILIDLLGYEETQLREWEEKGIV